MGPNERQRAPVGPNERPQRERREQPTRSRFGDAAMRTQARDALVAMGWKPGLARAATDEAITSVGTDVPIAELIREALRRCPKPLG